MSLSRKQVLYNALNESTKKKKEKNREVFLKYANKKIMQNRTKGNKEA